jgi:hypothetical protein
MQIFNTVECTVSNVGHVERNLSWYQTDPLCSKVKIRIPLYSTYLYHVISLIPCFTFYWTSFVDILIVES